MKKNIMFVDNSESALESLRWLFKDEPYDFVTFENPREALSALETKEFAAVIVDQALPEISGIEFLKIVKERSPNTLGIVMTAFVDSKTAIDAMNCGCVLLFVKKPLNSTKIKQAVAFAVSSYEIEVESQLLRPLKRS